MERAARAARAAQVARAARAARDPPSPRAAQAAQAAQAAHPEGTGVGGHTKMDPVFFWKCRGKDPPLNPAAGRRPPYR
eukprot:gene20666-biopygen11620